MQLVSKIYYFTRQKACEIRCKKIWENISILHLAPTTTTDYLKFIVG